MNSMMMKSALAVLALAAAPAFAAQDRDDAPVTVKTDHLTRLVAKKVKQHAEYGMPALRRYLWSTFHLHRVWLDDIGVHGGVWIAQGDGEVKVAQAESPVAAAK